MIITDAYMVDTKEGKMIPKSFCYNDNQVVFYHLVLDFYGDKIMDDPTVIDLKLQVLE